jgi:hypothetical protein
VCVIVFFLWVCFMCVPMGVPVYVCMRERVHACVFQICTVPTRTITAGILNFNHVRIMVQIEFDVS